MDLVSNNEFSPLQFKPAGEKLPLDDGHRDTKLYSLSGRCEIYNVFSADDSVMINEEIIDNLKEAVFRLSGDAKSDIRLIDLEPRTVKVDPKKGQKTLEVLNNMENNGVRIDALFGKKLGRGILGILS